MADIPTTIRFREIRVPLGALCREFLPGLPPSGNGLAACTIKARIVEKLSSLCLLTRLVVDTS